MENEIKIINKIIFESIRHGADPSGSYNCNAENLIESVEEWLKLKGLQNDYTIEEREVKSSVRRTEIPVITNPCPADGFTQREEMKNLIKKFDTDLQTVCYTILRINKGGVLCLKICKKQLRH